MRFEYVFFVIFILVAGNLLYQIIKNRGWRGAMFGAPTRSPTCEMELKGRGMMVRSKLRLHVLDPRDPVEGPHVGIEVIHSTIGSWTMNPVSLSREEARKLAEELTRAAKNSESGASPR